MAQFEEHPVPNGVANGTGLVGKYIMDTVAAASALPADSRRPAARERRWRRRHAPLHAVVAVPQQKAGKMPFARAITSNRRWPRHAGAGIFGGRTLARRWLRQDLKRDLRKTYGANVHFAGRGEMIPNEAAIAISTRASSISGEYPCCASTSSGATMKSTRRKHAGNLQGNHRCRGGKVTSTSGDAERGGIARRARSFMKWALPRWATAPRPACSISGAGVGLQEPVHHRRRALRQQRR